MPTVKTSELTGKALAWAVCFIRLERLLEGRVIAARDHATFASRRESFARPDRDWARGGPIIEIEKLDVWYRQEVVVPNHPHLWAATYERGLIDSYVFGPTPLVAAMRCCVAKYLGETVTVPDEVME